VSRGSDGQILILRWVSPPTNPLVRIRRRFITFASAARARNLREYSTGSRCTNGSCRYHTPQDPHQGGVMKGGLLAEKGQPVRRRETFYADLTLLSVCNRPKWRRSANVGAPAPALEAVQFFTNSIR
jgi:hypothetical protein